MTGSNRWILQRCKLALAVVLTLLVGRTAASASGLPAAEARADVLAGSLLALDGVVETLSQEVTATRARNLVWQESLGFGRPAHRIDWNPALDHLAGVLREDGGAVDQGLGAAAAAWNESDANTQTRRLEVLEAALSTLAMRLRVVAQYLACIRASQAALHEVSSPLVLGRGVGFSNGLIEHTNRLASLLERLKHGMTPALSDQSERALWAARNYTERYFEGLEEGQRLLVVAKWAGLLTTTLGLGEAILGVRAVLAQLVKSTPSGGGLVAAAAGGGSVVLGNSVVVPSAIAIETAIRAAARPALSSVLLMAGGRGPVDKGKAGEAAAGITGPKTQHEWPDKSGRFIRPDRVTATTVEEVKNVERLSRTRQLVKYLDYAEHTHREFILRIPRTTKLSKKLQRLINREAIKVEYLP